MGENYYNVRKKKGDPDGGRWTKDPGYTSLMGFDGMFDERSPAAAQYRPIPIPSLKHRPEGGWPKHDRPEKPEHIPVGSLVMTAEGWAKKIVADGALELIPTNVEEEPEAVAAAYKPPSWLNRTVLKIVIETTPPGHRINWSRMDWAKMAATVALPFALMSSGDRSPGKVPHEDIQKLLLQSTASHSSIVAAAPRAREAKPETIVGDFNATTEAEAAQPKSKLTARPWAPAPIAPVVESAPAKEPLPSRQLIHTAPERISNIFARINKDTPTLRDVMVEVLGSESGFDPKAKSKTGARGLGQFTAPTLIERVYLDRHLFPESAKATADLVYRYNDAKPGQKPRYKYDVLGDSKKEHTENRKKVLALAYDVETAAIMAQRYIVFNTLHAEEIFRKAVQKKIDTIEKKNIGKPFSEATEFRLTKLREALTQDITVAFIKQVYTNGVGGASKTMIANADPVSAKHASKDHAAPATLRHNSEFYRAGNKDRTVAETVAHAEGLVGDWVVPMDELILAAR